MMTSDEHLDVIARMKRGFLFWFAAMAGTFLIILGVVAHQVQRVASESCESTSEIIDIMIDYNNDIMALQVPKDEFQRESVRLRAENNRLLQKARCSK